MGFVHGRAVAFGALLLSSSFASAEALAQSGVSPYGAQPAATGPAATAPANTGAPDSNLQAGGLRPPGELEQEEPVATETEQELEQADQKDSGRGLEFVWLQAEAGYQHVDLLSLDDDDLLPDFDKDSQDGFVFGGAAGVRLLYFTAGARFRLGSFDTYQLWSILGEVGMHFPLGDLEPYFNVGFGYASVGSFATESLTDAAGGDVEVRGFDLRAALGVDYYLSSTFSLGAQVSGDLLFLTRPSVSASSVSGYAEDGSSTGTSLQITAVAGIHF